MGQGLGCGEWVESGTVDSSLDSSLGELWWKGAVGKLSNTAGRPPGPYRAREAEDSCGSDGSCGGRQELLGAKHKRETW